MSFHSKSSTTEALVIKRNNTGETDRIVTLLTRDGGKLAAVAKGVRQLKSSRGAYLEPGNYIKCQLIITKSLPILTQATLLDDSQAVRDSLPHVRQLLQLLEFVDALFVESQGEGEVFDDILTLRDWILKRQSSSEKIRDGLAEVIIKLGYQPLQETNYENITQYVSALADKPMRSWEYLKV